MRLRLLSRLAVSLAGLVAVLATVPLVGRVSAQAPAGLDLGGLSAARMLAHTRFLADDLLEGRAPRARGGDLAARYIATQFELLGLQPGAEDGTWYQAVPIVEATVARDRTTLSATGPRGTRAFTMGQDLSLLASVDAPSVALDAGVVFVGHGIVAPEYGWTGAVEDARLMADLGWRIAALPRMPAYKAGDQFAQPRAAKGGR